MADIDREFNHKVSVIIPTTSRELSLANRCAETVKMSFYKNIEVIIVNEGKERSEQRNIGLERATGNYILYLDSDQLVSLDLIGECVGLMNCGYGAIYIPEIIISYGLFAYIRNWERQFYTGTEVDCVRFFKRNGLRFDTSLSGPEDADFDRRVPGFRAIAKNPIYHDDGVGVKDYFHKKAYYSKSMRKFVMTYPHDKVLNFWWRCFGVFFERGKWKRFLSRPDLALCVMLIILARGVIYLVKR